MYFTFICEGKLHLRWSGTRVTWQDYKWSQVSARANAREGGRATGSRPRSTLLPGLSRWQSASMPVIKLFSLAQVIGSITFILPVSITVKYQVSIMGYLGFLDTCFLLHPPQPPQPLACSWRNSKKNVKNIWKHKYHSKYNKSFYKSRGPWYH